MRENSAQIISQLTAKLEEYFNEFEKSYNQSDKEKFESSKKAILEINKKIDFILKQ